MFCDNIIQLSDLNLAMAEVYTSNFGRFKFDELKAVLLGLCARAGTCGWICQPHHSLGFLPQYFSDVVASLQVSTVSL